MKKLYVLRKNKRNTKSRIRFARKGVYQHRKARQRRNKKFVSFIPVPIVEKNFRKERKERNSITLRCPSNFTISGNIDEVVKFNNSVRNVKFNKYQKVMIDLSDVTSIEISSIVMLLSNINHIGRKGIFVSGNYPKDSLANKIFEESGFLSHMNSLSSGKSITSNSHNLIVNIGKDKVTSQETAKISQLALAFLKPKAPHHQRLNSIVGEMAGNTIEYAYNYNKHYLYGFSHKDDTITFIFSDSGYGILNTLKKRFHKIISDILTNKGPISVLDGAFDKKYGSRTHEANRNKGLPFIKKNFIENIIDNLYVISNNVFLDFKNNQNSKELKENYSGTLYVWTINKNNIKEYYGEY